MSEDELVALRRAVAGLSGRLGEALGARDAAEERLAAAEASRRDWAAEAMRTDELLRQAADALRDVGKKALVVKPTLSQPYPDAPDWTPWTRFLGPAASTAYNLGSEIRSQRAQKRPQEPVCACTFDDQATQLGPGFTGPVCAVHPPEEST